LGSLRVEVVGAVGGWGGWRLGAVGDWWLRLMGGAWLVRVLGIVIAYGAIGK
jgi:hypothetical protein